MVCSIDYVELIRKKIMQQDFSYPALSPSYEEWKRQNYPNAKTFWHLGGELVQAIQSMRFGLNEWAATIPEGVSDSGGKSYGRTSRTEILTYAMTLEEGYDPFNIKARPLFAPTNEEYAQNGYLDKVEEVRKSLLSVWRKT